MIETLSEPSATLILPPHLAHFAITQDYAGYRAIDQQTWNTVISRLIPFWERNAHPGFLEGIRATGVDAGSIPDLTAMDAKLQRYGWRLIPVDGFIPPAIFMEFHSIGVLPVTCFIRKPENLEYTPAPDIVHEGACHAPLLSNRLYGQFLKRFGELAMQAGFSEADHKLYEIIRHLSDIKESRTADPAEVARAEQELKDFSKTYGSTSTGTRLTRLFWWTVEYGLMGSLDDPKIYGAGLLSSLGEGPECLKDHVPKIPLTLDCIEVSYDITSPQPQLFVAESFQHIFDLLEEFARKFNLD